MKTGGSFLVYESKLLPCGCRIQFQVGREPWDNSSSIIYHDINLPDSHKSMVKKLLDEMKQISLHT